jgi:very-short-patch-repair endonuclease
MLIDRVLDESNGVASRADLLEVLSIAQLGNALRRGELVRIAPRHFARPWNADDQAILELAAVRSAGGGAALSHLTALRRWSLPVPPVETIHVTTPIGQRVLARSQVVIHRTRRPIDAIARAGASTVRPALAIVGSWPMLRGSGQRAPAIRAVAQRLVTPGQLRATVDEHITLPGRAQLQRLVRLLEAGCRSELELWGYLSVFNIRDLREAVRQRPITVKGKTYYLDQAYEQERLCVELDGRGYHSSTERWESDIARDLALATLGWQTIRLSHHRLTTDVDGCRADVLRVLRARR